MSEAKSKWVLDESQMRSPAKNQKIFVDLKKNQSVEITHLNPDGEKPPALKVMKIYGYKSPEDKYPSYVLCPASPEEACPVMDYWGTLEDGRDKDTMSPVNYYCYSVIIQEEDDKGEMYPAQKQIRLLKKSQTGFLDQKIEEVSKITKGALKDVAGLQGETYLLSRSDDQMAARVGTIGSHLNTADLASLLDNPEPHTLEELLESFESNIEDQVAYVERMESEGSIATKPVIKRN